MKAQLYSGPLSNNLQVYQERLNETCIYGKLCIFVSVFLAMHFLYLDNFVIRLLYCILYVAYIIRLAVVIGSNVICLFINNYSDSVQF